MSFSANYQDKGPAAAPSSAPAPAPASPGQAAKEGGGEGAPPGGLGGGFFQGPGIIVMMVALIAFMFWSSSRQRKKQQKLISALKRGDRVLTQAGIVGRLDDVEERYARLEIAPGVKIRVLRSSLAGKDGTPEATAEATKKA